MFDSKRHVRMLAPTFLFLSLSLVLCLRAFGAEIAVYGDSQHNPKIQQKLVHTIVSYKPSIVFRVGDIVDNGNDPKLWKAFNKIHGPLLKTTEYFPALGNHEFDSALYFKNFPFLNNRRWYSIDREGIHFIVLDSNSDLKPGSEQYKWLTADLAGVNSSAKFKIALFHHPIFDVSGGHVADEKNLKDILLPLFKKYGVSAVFSGHSHCYERFEYEGMQFVVTGGGGSRLYAQDRRPSPYLKKFESTYHFCLLAPRGESLIVRVIDINSKVIDTFKIKAEESAESPAPLQACP